MRNLISACLFVLCCKKEREISLINCNDPLKQKWFNDLKNSITNCTCQKSIMQGEYQNDTVFYVMMNDPLCDGVFPVILLDCSGNPVKEYQNNDETFLSEVKFVKSVYSCKE